MQRSRLIDVMVNGLLLWNEQENATDPTIVEEWREKWKVFAQELNSLGTSSKSVHEWQIYWRKVKIEQAKLTNVEPAPQSNVGDINNDDEPTYYEAVYDKDINNIIDEDTVSFQLPKMNIFKDKFIPFLFVFFCRKLNFCKNMNVCCTVI